MTVRASLLWLLLGSFLASPAAGQDREGGFAVSAGEITIQEEESPLAANHGILPKMGNANSFSWKGSDAEALKTLLSEFKEPLAWQSQRRVVTAALTSPVLPDAEGSVPLTWLTLRLEALYRMGEYNAAWNLFRTLNSHFLTEPTARMGANLAWATRRARRACAITASVIANEKTNFESEDSRLYWLVHYALCQRIEGKKEEAEVSLGLLLETVPHKVPPILAPLMHDWDSGKVLPPLSAKDALMYPALASLLMDSARTPAPLHGRIPSNFIAPDMLSTLPPELQAALSEAISLPPLLRAGLAETGVRYHFIEGSQLGRFYRRAADKHERPTPKALVDTYERALLYADVRAARTPRNQQRAIEQALRAYHRFFDAHEARAVLGSDLRQLYSDEREILDVPMTYEVIGLYLDRGDQDEARSVARSLNYRDDPASELAASIAGRILKLNGDETMYLSEEIRLPDFTQAASESIVWLMQRYGRVMEHLGYRVQWPARPLEGSAPPADIVYASPERLNALRAARAMGSPAEQVLRAALVLNGTPPQRTSDQALLQVLTAWNEVGLRAQANALAAEALLGIPDRREP